MKSISKKVYLLVVMAIISFCAVLFPMSVNTVKADVTISGADLAVKTAVVQVQKVADDEGNREWAILFKAQITQTAMEAVGDRQDVRFGMLIGPTSRVADNTTYAQFVADGVDFVPFAHVRAKNVKFEEGSTTFDYYAGIRFNDKHFEDKGMDKIAAGKMDLTAIPFYIVGEGDSAEYIVNLAGAKNDAEVLNSIQARNALTQEYAKDIENGIQDHIPLDAVNNYAGTFEQKYAEAYICKSTNRLMTASEVNGDLVATEFTVASGDELFINGKVKADLGLASASSLAVDGSSRVICYTGDGKVVYFNAKHAEKVITRFFSLDDVGTDLTLADYFADGSTGKNIFYMASATEKTFPGLYVLANDITPVFGRKESTSVGSQYTTKGYGFIGTFDGRGKVIDYNWLTNGTTALSSHSGGGIFPSATGATIKNFAVKNARSDHGAVNNTTHALVGYAYNTLFENIYFHYCPGAATQEYNGGGNERSLFIYGASGSTFNNVIVECGYSEYMYNRFGQGYYIQKTMAPYGSSRFTRTTDENGVLTDVTLNSKLTNGNDCCWGGFQNGLFGKGRSDGGNGGYTITDFKSSNLIAVGNPIYVYQKNTMTAFNKGLDGIALEVYMVVSQVPSYIDSEGNTVQCNTTGDAVTFYTEDQFAGTDWADYVAPYYDYAENFMLNKMGAWIELALAQGRKIAINFKVIPGTYDMRSASDLANWVKNADNKDALDKFDEAYWVVDATAGTITWKGLSA